MTGTLSGGLRGAIARAARARSSLALGGVLVSLGAVPAASAHKHSREARDAVATRAYIEADYRLARAGRSHLPASFAAISALVQHTVGECPLAGEGAYVNRAANQVSEEVIDTVEVAAYQPDLAALRAAEHAFEHLRWSSGVLTRRVHGLAVKLQNLVAMQPANVCADVKAYAATGFSTAPETTVQFIKLFEAADVESDEVPQRLLAPYEGPREAKLMRTIKRVESAIAEAETRAVAEWMAIMRGLDLSI